MIIGNGFYNKNSKINYLITIANKISLIILDLFVFKYFILLIIYMIFVADFGRIFWQSLGTHNHY